MVKQLVAFAFVFLGFHLLAQDNLVYMYIKNYEVMCNSDLEGSNDEWRFSFWINGDEGNTQVTAVDGGNTWQLYGADKTITLVLDASSFELTLRGWEEDNCGGDLSYNPGCDDEMNQNSRNIFFRNYSSGQMHQMDLWAPNYFLYRFEFYWYPWPYSPGMVADLSKWESGLLTPITLTNLCPGNYQLKSPRKASVDNNVWVFYEYQDRNGNWINLPNSPVQSDTLSFILDNGIYQSLRPSNKLFATLNFRVSRRTPTGGLPPNSSSDFFAIYLNKFLLPPPPVLALDTLFGLPPTCNGDSNAILNLPYSEITGFGFGHYKYSLRGCADFVTCEYQAGTRYVYQQDALYDSLRAGNHILVITDIENSGTIPGKAILGCSNYYPVIIPEKPLLQITSVTDSVYTNTEVRCFNTQDGVATITIRGGNPPYVAAENSGGPWQTVQGSSHKFYNLAPGDHTFFAGDSKNCPVASIADNITVPDTLRLYLQQKRQYVSDLIQPGERHVSCFHASDGAYTVHARCDIDGSKVNPNFRYWITGTNTQGIQYASDTLVGNSTNLSGTDGPEIFTNLRAGFYTIHLKDNNDCSFSDTFTLREPSPLSFNALALDNNNCSSGKEGVLKALAGGSTRPYSFYKDAWNPYPNDSWRVCTRFQWSEGACNIADQHNTGKTWEDTVYYSNLPSYTHTAYVRDTNGCITALPFTIAEPAPLLPQVQIKNVACKGESNGSLIASVSGGVAPYSYRWSNLGIPLVSNDTLQNVRAGKYLLEIQDGNGCKNTTGAGPYDVLEANFPLTASAHISQPISCADNSNASIEVTALGGGTYYQFAINGGNWQTKSSFDHLSAGTYVIQVKDNMGCQIVLPPLEIQNPDALSATVTIQNTQCHNSSDGSISLVVSGGTAPYYYKENNLWTQVNNAFVLSGKSAGTHLIELRDGQNCQLNKSIEIQSPPALSFTILSTTEASINQNDGEVAVQAVGGTSPYSFQWLDEQNSLVSTSSVLSQVDAGIYFLHLSDLQGCDTLHPVGISNIGGPVEINSSTTIVSPLCHNSSDGSIQVAYTGVGTLSYTWYPGAVQGTVLNGIPAGSYVLKVVDGNGSVTTASYVVQAAEPLSVQSSTDHLICHNGCNASINLGVTGGTSPYDVRWNSGETASQITMLCAGMYSFEITDAHSCKQSGQVEILNPSPILVDLGEDQVLCRGQAATLDAGITNVNYAWNTGANSKRIQVSAAGWYSVEVTTPEGCSGTDTIQIEVNDNLLAAVNYNATKIYAGTTVVFVDVSWPRPDRLEWDFGDSAVVVNDDNITLPQVMFPYPGTFIVTMIATLGDCKDTIFKPVKVFATTDSLGYQNGRYVAGVEAIHAFPNPTSTQISISVTLYDQADLLLQMVDGFGNIVKSEYQEGSNQFQLNWDLLHLTNGVYFIRAISGNSQKSIIVTKQ
ncbi:MAG: T9SS type A sorting domain-containing protein [Cytophagaceae bacterium]|jgi:hypothetical protein|nr:T9SS type A sorting domain-containing protein [Cytophagaceae bacterium]